MGNKCVRIFVWIFLFAYVKFILHSFIKKIDKKTTNFFHETATFSSDFYNSIDFTKHNYLVGWSASCLYISIIFLRENASLIYIWYSRAHPTLIPCIAVETCFHPTDPGLRLTGSGSEPLKKKWSGSNPRENSNLDSTLEKNWI